MTKGGSSKPNMLGRLIFGEKRKQHASPSRHRSSTRKDGNATDVAPSHGGAANKNPINLHDWAIWRMHLNEQMENGMTEQTDLKQLKQFLHSNPFYQQHSRDPSNGRYNGVKLLFSIPHAKLKSELNDGSRGVFNKNSNMNVGDSTTFDQHNTQPNIDDRTPTCVNSVVVGPPMVIDKTISQLLPKKLIKDPGDFLHINEQMVAAELAQFRCSMRASYTAADRVHSTLQKAVKDGNVLEKIKAFEMQAAAAQAESAPKLGGGGGGVSNIINNRIQTVTPSIQSAAQRTLSPAMVHSIQHPISPIPIQHELQQQQPQQYIRSHKGRYVHPIQHRRDGHLGPTIGRESRKGAHVLEPAHGDIILKRRTPSQKTVNDDDYSMTAVTSLAVTAPQGHHHRQHHHHHHRANASRSRHRQESVHDKRSLSRHENGHKKHQQKQKEITTSSSNKTSTRRRWLKGRKETPTETATENSKQDASTNKSSKNHKNKKKNTEKEKLESTKKEKSPESKGKTSDNNRVYGVPTTTVNDETKIETISPQPPSRIDEENESDREEDKNTETETNHTRPEKEEEEEITQHNECESITTTNVIRRPSKAKYHQKLSSTDGEVISKIEEDTRFSRPTDDHAHRSDLNDEDDEYKSEGDVFIDESSITTINPQQSLNIIRCYSNQPSAEQLTSDRRWQWSKESGGLIEKSNRKKNELPITIITRKNEINQQEEGEQTVYEIPRSEQNPTPKLKKQSSFHSITPTEINIESNNNKPISKQILNAIMNSKNNNNTQEQITADEFFENGPHTNPEETIVNIASSA